MHKHKPWNIIVPYQIKITPNSDWVRLKVSCVLKYFGPNLKYTGPNDVLFYLPFNNMSGLLTGLKEMTQQLRLAATLLDIPEHELITRPVSMAITWAKLRCHYSHFRSHTRAFWIQPPTLPKLTAPIKVVSKRQIPHSRHNQIGLFMLRWKDGKKNMQKNWNA